jgi:hypothetical protein
MREPNLFDFATSELSQDAFICWLASWAKPECRQLNEPLHTTATRFLSRLLEAGKVRPPLEYRSIEVKRQRNHIDVRLVVNGEIAIVIEDKTNSRDHSDQLQRYRKAAAVRFPEDQIAAVYLKTGDQCDYDRARQAGYGCFLRADFLRVLDEGKRGGVCNVIFDDFRDYLRAMDDAVRCFDKIPLEKWDRPQWMGFFKALKERLGDGDWANRGHGGGGSLTFRWHEREGKYLGLHEDELGFRIQVNEEMQRRAKRDLWAESLKNKNGTAGIKINFLAHRGLGNRMKVAVLECGDYRQKNDQGLLDLDRTLDTLKRAEKLMDAAL